MDLTRPRSATKRTAILEAAKVAFLRDGFAAGNLDAIATAAGVSKVTIYHHFGSKDELFTAVLTWVIAERTGSKLERPLVADPAGLVAALVEIGVELIETVSDGDVLGLRRILIAEQVRRPHFAAAWRRKTTQAATQTLTQYFEGLRVEGLLAGVDPAVLARQYLWMLIGDALDAGLLVPGDPRPSSRTVARDVAQTVVQAYTPRG